MKGKVLIKGSTAVAGIAQGYVRLVKGLASDVARIEKGDIMVCDSFTYDGIHDECIKRAGALIMNKGGRASYGAVNCRERGLPCITDTEEVGRGKATDVLKDGVFIIVEGNSGEMAVVGKDGTTKTIKYGTVYQYI